MLRVVQFLVSSSSSCCCCSLHKWKPLGNSTTTTNGLSFLSTRSSSSSSSSSLYFPLVSIRGKKKSFFRSFRFFSAIRSQSKPDDASSSSSSLSHSPAVEALSHMRKVCFCQWCGAATKQAIPDGDDKIRAICTSCGRVAYQNPKMVTGCLVEHDNKVLLCKRNISPSYGLWTLPAGYMEVGESAVDGATRETLEEAGAEVEVLSPFAQLDIPLIGQTYIMFRAKLKNPQFSPGPESLECRLFTVDDIPFESLAFSSMLVTLNLYIEDLKSGELKFHYCTINKRPGTGPSDIHDFTLDKHLNC